MIFDRRTFLLTATAVAACSQQPVARAAAGPDPYANATWRKLTPADWKQRLPAESFAVLREESTEAPFSSPLDKLYKKGTYVCLGCGLPLFKSDWKFDSGTGWPSFFTAIPGVFEMKKDFFLMYPRTEYHCARCGGHHGHLFDDGPPPTGQRYCNNGVALKFIPKQTA